MPFVDHCKSPLAKVFTGCIAHEVETLPRLGYIWYKLRLVGNAYKLSRYHRVPSFPALKTRPLLMVAERENEAAC